MMQPASFTDPGIDLECETCGSTEFEQDEDEFEDTDGRCYRAPVLICVDCGQVLR